MAGDASTRFGYADAIIDTVLEAAIAGLGTRSSAAKSPWLVGLSGLQGSGTSTLAQQLVAHADAHGIRTQILSLDDFYLGRRARTRLARSIHPLLATRGVPGTHDIDLLLRSLRDLAHASELTPAALPRFDKGRDTRLQPSRWRRVTERPHLIVLEGWCVGAPPQSADALARPLNALERNEDRDGRWRSWINARLADTYVNLWKKIDALIVLQAPNFARASHWRDEQERVLRRCNAPRALDSASLARFMLHYERLSRHALRELPARADLRLELRPDRSVRRFVHTRCHDGAVQRTGSATTAAR
ncbi:MAG: kinase [Dokdonella sp.]